MLLVLALSGVAAGSTQNASPQKWAHTLCTSLVTWQHTVKTEFTKLKTTVDKLKKNGNADPVKAKHELVSFLGRIVSSTNVLIGKIKAVGAPNTKNGDKLQKTLISGLGQLNKAFKNAKKSAQSLPTGSRKAFSQGAQRLATTLQASDNQVGTALSGLAKYDTKELDQAFKSDPACKQISG